MSMPLEPPQINVQMVDANGRLTSQGYALLQSFYENILAGGGGGSGDMLAANNLSDVADAATSRTNLGLGTAATTAGTDYATAAQGALADTATQPGDLATVATTGAYSDLTGTPAAYDFAKRSSTSTGTAAPRLMVPWQTELAAGTDITWSSGNNTRLTIATTGTYRIGGFLTYSSTIQRAQANGEIFINGVNEGVFRGDTYIRNSGSSWDYGVIEISTEPFAMTAADYFEVGVARTSGADASYTTGAAGPITLRGTACRVWVERVA